MVLNIGAGENFGTDRMIWEGGGGMRGGGGGTMHFKSIGRGLVPAIPPPLPHSYAYVLLVVSADICHLFYAYVDH